MKKKLLTCILLIVCLWISSCSLVQNDDENNSQSDSSPIQWEDYAVIFEGSNDTDDNPWGYTAGIIESEYDGQYLFLTPNTSVEICNISQNEMLSLQTRIHPWVAQSSDGAGVMIWFMNDKDDILYQENIEIAKDGSWKDMNLDIINYDEISKVKILCNNGKNNDDSADWVVIRKSQPEFVSDFGAEGYVKSATYFADEWPINFWNSEMDNLTMDLEQIKNDGFNSIIIVIPWKEFQTSIEPIVYSEYAFDNLKKVMVACDEIGLDVYARIGYSWDYYNDENEYILERYIGLMGDSNVQEAWYDYAESLYSVLSDYESFQDAFLTWEDFWGVLAICDLESDNDKLEYAKNIGYQEWIENNFSIDEFNRKYETAYDEYIDIPVPKRTDMAMESMYRFYDQYLNSLLKSTQSVFPNISMEVRLDADLVTTKEGDMQYYSHNDTYLCEDSDFTATMYGIPMGCENKGEKISAEEAMSHTQYILSSLLDYNMGKPVYIEQFLFLDNTPEFSYNAQIKEDEIGIYLENVSSILDEYTKGYGIWTYRDYRNNMIYNGQFALEGDGWVQEGTPSFVYDDKSGSMICEISSGDKMMQRIMDIRNHFDSDEYIVSFDVVEVEKKGKILISVGEREQQIEISQPGEYKVLFEKNSCFDLSILAQSGQFKIDNLNMYSFIQEGHLYNIENEELEYISNIRILNEKLK